VFDRVDCCGEKVSSRRGGRGLLSPLEPHTSDLIDKLGLCSI